MLTTISRLNWYNKALSHIGDYVGTSVSDNANNTVYTATHTVMKLAVPKVFNARLTCNIQEKLGGSTLISGFHNYPLNTATMLPQEIFLIRDRVSNRALSFSNLNSTDTNSLVGVTQDNNTLLIGQGFLNRLGVDPSNIVITYSSRPNFELPLATSYTIADELIDALALCAASRLAVVLEGNAQLAQVLDSLYQDTMQEIKATYGLTHQRSWFIGG